MVAGQLLNDAKKENGHRHQLQQLQQQLKQAATLLKASYFNVNLAK
jgi:hypothetical protein